MPISAIGLAFKPFKAQSIREIDDSALKLKAGLVAIPFGTAVMLFGWLIGGHVAEWLLRVWMGPNFVGVVKVPGAVVAVVVFGAFYGGLMVLIGCLRIIQVMLPTRSSLAAMVLLPALAIGLLLGLMWLFM